jgi:hypothetical protein
MNNPEPVSFTIHGVNPPDLVDAEQARQRRTRMGRIKMLLVLLVCASPVIASYFTYFVIRPEGRTNYGQLIAPTRAMPALQLTTLAGEAVLATRMRGQWLLLAVGPSACDTACEKRLFMQRQLREMLGRERDRVDKVWMVTDGDPLRPALVGALQAAPATQVLRADAAQLQAWLAPASGQALQDHLYIIDPMGEWMMRLPPDADPSRAKRDLDRLLRASSFWDEPGRTQGADVRPSAKP